MKAILTQAIAEVLVELGYEPVSFVVEYPTDKTAQADFFSNVALIVAGKLRLSPREVAETIVTSLKQKAVPQVASIVVAGPGFINITLERTYHTQALTEALTHPRYGSNESWSGKKVLVEYTDPNPFKEFHIGHLFTNAVGESIARLFMMNGAETYRVNYQGDVGLHVAHAIWGMQHLGITAETITPKILGQAYALGATTYKTDEAVAVVIRDINKKVYSREDETINALYDLGRSVSLQYFETIYAMVDTQFDEYFFESEAGPRGKSLVLDNPEIFPESDGARVFDGEARGLHTRVFLNREGLPTYEAKELALAKLKAERFAGYDLSVVSTANEINEYFKVLRCAMAEVYPDLAEKTEHIGHGMVRLATGKMSSRTGAVIAAIDFIAEVTTAATHKMQESAGEVDTATATDVAIAAIKYTTLRGSILQDSIFDKEQALSFEGDSGPYLQYTHARICSVLEKAAALGVYPDTQMPPAVVYDVEACALRFGTVIETALAERAPHKVATYLTELAGAFNSFYAVEKIADSTDQYAPYKAAVCVLVRTTLKNGLWALGIKAPERM